MLKKKLVVFTGSGISAESGIRTFRESGGLWEEYNIEEVATPQAWARDQHKVLDFYNKRRKQVLEALPNPAHYALADLEKDFDVHIITQNIDDLHERAGSSKVLHLHGEILKARSTADPGYVKRIEGWELKAGDLCPDGSQLRPHIVWFGEQVPAMPHAEAIVSEADIFIVVGTSLQVYPAAGLIFCAPDGIPKYLVDPEETAAPSSYGFRHIRLKAGEGVPEVAAELMKT